MYLKVKCPRNSKMTLKSNRTINQNSENNVLINNLGTAWPIQIFNAIF